MEHDKIRMSFYPNVFSSVSQQLLSLIFYNKCGWATDAVNSYPANLAFVLQRQISRPCAFSKYKVLKTHSMQRPVEWEKKNRRYRNFGFFCPYPVDNMELTPFWSLFLKKSEPPGFWPRWGYLAFNFASSAFSGLITLSSISWKTISDTVSETYSSVHLCRIALQVIHPHAHCCYQVSITIIWLDVFIHAFSNADSNCRSSASHFRHPFWRCWRCAHFPLKEK